MQTIDLRNKRCPIALVILKRFFLLQNSLVKADRIKHLRVLFTNEQAMQDIMLYLDNKEYSYTTNITDENPSLFIRLE